MTMQLLFPIFVLSSLTLASCLTRDVTHSINPGCGPSLCNNSDVDHVVNLVHFEAAGPRDSIHALWSTVGAPSALIAKTANDVNLTIDWERFVGVNFAKGSVVDPVIQFSSNPTVAFGFILRRLVEYDDKDDVANPDHYRLKNKTSSSRKVFPLDLLRWAPVKIIGNDTFVFQTASDDADLGDSLRLEVRMSGSLTRGDSLPRLQLTPNNTHLDLFLDNKTSLFAHSRFYLVADVVNDVYPLKLTQESTIDDEYTPGVFKTFRFGAADTKDVDDGRYAAWKPVAYTTSERSLEMETLVKAFDAAAVDPAVDDIKSVVGAYFGRIGKDDFSRQIKIGFGQQGDKFYKKTSFSVWSVLVGIGPPPEDEISALVIVVISIGLGVPALFVILGGIYAGLKERKARRSASPKRQTGLRAPLVEEGPHETYGAIGT